MKKVVDKDVKNVYYVYQSKQYKTIRKEVTRMELNLGKKIRDRRKALKMSQEVLAKKSNLSRVRISAIENGKSGDILISTLLAIASALETDAEFFLR